MIEGLAILFVFMTAALIYLGARVQAQNASRDPRAEAARLQESLIWHEERLRLAKEKNWDDGMINQIAGQLDEIQGKLADFNLVHGNAPRRHRER
jgi:hypothetical protein